MTPPTALAGHQQHTQTTAPATGTSAAAVAAAAAAAAALNGGGHHSRDLGKKRAAENDMFQLVHDAFLICFYFCFLFIFVSLFCFFFLLRLTHISVDKFLLFDLQYYSKPKPFNITNLILNLAASTLTYSFDAIAFLYIIIFKISMLHTCNTNTSL